MCSPLVCVEGASSVGAQVLACVGERERESMGVVQGKKGKMPAAVEEGGGRGRDLL